ncbi:MBL fold metallo-hydrolase [Sphingobacterium sp. SYP-B4668]|uniref:MBL fold metallo-hydrolase n=1 Tax=Sphingobacterium sp. SYP-B4668 TaxID=2996035 RepID=UPI0022DE7718|nr:MBL fold metallo-hydrolase [Sphingobacterium sp. SYP-B4668]
MKKSNLLMSFFLFVSPYLVAQTNVHHVEVGKLYKGWKDGELDIHHVYTGRGESSFLILPDGTTLLIDVGDWDPTAEEYAFMTPQLPDSSIRAGQRVARYIQSVNPNKDQIDYLLVSHFHNDHTGDASKGAGRAKSPAPGYQLSGIAELGEYIHIHKVIDRDYPRYDFPKPLVTDADFANYQNFIQWKSQSAGLATEKFEVGSNNQITLLRNKSAYSHFEVKNLFNNGLIWNNQTQRVDTIYKHEYQENKASWNENTMSNGFRLTYGNFTYYSGGDLSGHVLDKNGQYVDIEGLAAQSCGEVDVAKANHHAYKDAMTPGFLKYIQAASFIVPVWDKAHIQPEIIARIEQVSSVGNRSIPHLIYTYFPEELRSEFRDKSWARYILEDGHVVVKVFDNGRRYSLYVLDAHHEQRIVKAVYGPFIAKGIN